MDIFFQELMEWFLTFGHRWLRILLAALLIVMGLALLSIGLWWPR